jgi:hypothetical protein
LHGTIFRFIRVAVKPQNSQIFPDFLNYRTRILFFCGALDPFPLPMKFREEPNPRHNKCAKSLAGQKTSQFFEVKLLGVLFFADSRIFSKLHARFLTINDLIPAIILGLFQ